MIDRRPHTLVAISSSGGIYDKEGDWVPGSPHRSAPVPCRFEGNSAAMTVKLEDGTDYRYSYIVFKDIDRRFDFQVGQEVELYDEGSRLAGRFTVKGFSRGQMNERIWV